MWGKWYPPCPPPVTLLLEVNHWSRRLTAALRKIWIIYKQYCSFSKPRETEQKPVYIAVGTLSTSRRELRRVMGKKPVLDSSGLPLSDWGAESHSIIDLIILSENSPATASRPLNHSVLMTVIFKPKRLTMENKEYQMPNSWREGEKHLCQAWLKEVIEKSMQLATYLRKELTGCSVPC